MKRKSTRDIPDFSALRKKTPMTPEAERKSTHASQTAARNVKPPATSAKSGRRGA
ncbi:MAG: hypothetical protein ACT4P7_05690 [Gemmatimonadaceae bacterium]